MGVPWIAGRTSGLKRGKRKGWDQSMSSEKGEDGERCACEEVLLRVKEEMELTAAFLSACRDVVRLDVKLGFGFGVEARLVLGERIKPSSGSSSSGGGTRGWLKAHSSAVGRDRPFSLFKLELDF